MPSRIIFNNVNILWMARHTRQSPCFFTHWTHWFLAEAKFFFLVCEWQHVTLYNYCGEEAAEGGGGREWERERESRKNLRNSCLIFQNPLNYALLKNMRKLLQQQKQQQKLSYFTHINLFEEFLEILCNVLKKDSLPLKDAQFKGNPKFRPPKTYIHHEY